MGKDSPGKLKQKDIERIAETQARYNRVNQVTPFGSLTFSGNTATTTLSPEQQALLEQQQIAQALAGEVATGRLGELGAGREAVERATFDRALSLLNPELERREAQLRQRLANQGLPQTSGAFTSELGRFETGVNDQLERLALSAVLAGGQEESRLTEQILRLLGYSAPVGSLPLINVPQVTIPVSPPSGGGASPASAILGLGGLAAGAMLAPPGMNIQGAQLGFAAGSQLPFLAGF